MKKILITISLNLFLLNAFSQTTYYWVGGLVANYTTAASWNTALNGSGSPRTTPAGTDILIYDGTNVGGAVPTTGRVTSNITGTGNTCAQLKCINGARITIGRLTAGSATITINGDGTAADDLVVGAIDTLTLGGKNQDTTAFNFDVNIQLLTNVTTGLISGTVFMGPPSTTNGPHCRSYITAQAGTSLVFATGSSVYCNDSISVNGFNSSVANSITFKTGSSLYYYSGRSPIGSNSTTQFVVFESGSNCYIRANNYIPSSSWSNSKNYANLFIQEGATFTSDGTFYKIENLTIDNGCTLITHTSGATPILGNLVVNGTLNYPGGSSNNLVMGGHAAQTISGTGTITIPNFVVANFSDVTLLKNIQADISSQIYGKLNFGAGNKITGTGTFTSKVKSTANVGGLTGNIVAGSYQITGFTASALSGNLGLSVTGTTGIDPVTNVIHTTSGGGVLTMSKPATATLTGVLFNFSSDSATLVTSNPNGFDTLTGSVTVTGAKSFQGGTNYIINATTTAPFGITTGNTSFVTLGNLTLNAPVTTNYYTRLTGTLTVNSGNLTLRPTDTMRISSGNDILGSLNASKYIVCSSSGNNVGVLRIDNFSTAKTFPVGTATKYLPVTLTPTSAMDYAVSVFEGATMDGTPLGTPVSPAQLDRSVNATWTINRVTGTGDCTIQPNWTASLEGAVFSAFSNAQIGIARYNGSSWDPFTGSGDNTANTATSTFSSFSPFMVGELGAIIPVYIRSISATAKTGGIDINWSVENEISIQRYVVERSSNGTEFSAIGFVNAGNRNAYSFTDASLLANVFYYRIKVLGLNGYTKYSNIVVVKKNAIKEITVYPNPVTSYLVVSGLENSSTLNVINSKGQIVRQQITNANSLSLDMSELKTGIYILEVLNEKGRIISKTFIKQ